MRCAAEARLTFMACSPREVSQIAGKKLCASKCTYCSFQTPFGLCSPCIVFQKFSCPILPTYPPLGYNKMCL